VAELKENKGGSWKERLSAFLLLLILFVPLLYIDGFVVASAAKACPDGTFLSGRVHSWNGWGIAFLGTAIWFLTGQVIGRFRKTPNQNRDVFYRVMGKAGTIILATFVATTLVIYWVASSAQFCLATDAIHYRQLPWQTFHTQSWSNVAKIAVQCSNGHRAPDLHYKLTFSDGAVLDIADAFPTGGTYPQFQAHLANVPFKFTADIRSGCPEWFSDWIGQRP
jgi:hypothetical protein